METPLIPSPMRLFLVVLAALLVSALGGCDFTPSFDVPVPDFEPALTINGVLAADSTVELRITTATDPYDRFGQDFVVPDGVQATLLREGVSVGPIRAQTRPCPSNQGGYTDPDLPPCTYTVFVSDVVTEPGVTYTVRVTAPGFPEARATVTLPARPVATATAGVVNQVGPRTDVELALSLRDRPGLGDRYALMVVTGPYTYEQPVYCWDAPCPDSTVTRSSNRTTVQYTTSDPVLLAAARTVPSGRIDIVTFTDETFDGTERTFRVRAEQFNYESPGGVAPLAAVRVVAIDAATFGAYQIVWLGSIVSGDGENPFAEPVNLPSNVEGGYGILGAVTITEALLPD